MGSPINDLVRQRKSVRTYQGISLREDDQAKIEDYLNSLRNPFGVPIEFRILDAKKEQLSSRVIVGGRQRQ